MRTAHGQQAMPDLLYIHTDQHNPFVTGCYGNSLVSTPHLDALAEAGTVFDSAYCTSPLCVPSRMSMLTGRHPYQNQVWTNDHMLRSDIPTIAHAMGAAGHHPVLIGRMHSVGPDQLHGYVERIIGDHSSNFVGGVDHDMGDLTGTAGPERISLRNSGRGQSPYQIHDECVGAATVDFLNNVGIKRRAGEKSPFCLSVGFMLPHPPYVARQQDFDHYAGRVAPPDKPDHLNDQTHPFLREWRSSTGIAVVNKAEQDRARAAYWGLVTRVDDLIGQIFEALSSNRLSENCLIVYTSDHGDMLGEHGLWWKHVFYEEAIRVPLIISWPGVIASGHRCSNVVSSIDVSATLVQALGGTGLPGSPGRSLLPLIQRNENVGANVIDSSVSWVDEAFAEYCSDRYVPSVPVFQRMMRSGPWKLVYYHGERSQLFNLEEDPQELHDRADDPSCAEVIASMMQRLKEDWDPDVISLNLQEKDLENQLIKEWTQATKPPDLFRWPLHGSMARLENQTIGE